MAELDGLGLVYEKAGNTGAAAYNQPTLTQGNTPFDVLAARQYQQKLIDEQRAYEEKKQAEKDKKAALKDLEDIPLSNFTIANQQELAKEIVGYKAGLVDILNKGGNPLDPTDPNYLQAQQKKLLLQNKIQEANKQGATVDAARKLLQADMATDNPNFDVEKSAANLKAYMSAPNVEARKAIDPETLLVKKEVPFDTYAAIKGVTGETFADKSQYKKGTDEYVASGESKKFNEEKATTYSKQWFENTPQGKANFERGVREGTWKTVDEAAKVQAERLKQTMKAESSSSFETKAPKEGWSIIDIQGKGDDELVSTFKLGTGTAKIKSGQGGGQEEVVPLYNQTQLPNINAVISGADAIDATTGKPLDDTESVKLPSGTISTPLTWIGTNRLVAIPKKGTYKFYNDITKKNEEITGTQKEISDELVARGVAKYTPMVSGVAEKTDGTKVTIYVNSKTAIPNTGEKALKGADAVHAVETTLADRMNEKAKKKSIKTTTTVVPKGRVR